jgi:hypothetical protein
VPKRVCRGLTHGKADVLDFFGGEWHRAGEVRRPITHVAHHAWLCRHCESQSIPALRRALSGPAFTFALVCRHLAHHSLCE